MNASAILDDLRRMGAIDKSNMLSFCVDAPRHYREAAKLAETISVDYRNPENIVLAGMGGSAIGSELLKDWARDKIAVPIEVCREYTLPAYAKKKTLVIVGSYSGETEESLSVLLNASRRGCMIVCISSGGKLYEFAEKMSLPHLLVPPGIAPRATLPYLFVPLPVLMGKIGLIPKFRSEIPETVGILKSISDQNSPEVPLKSNFAKALASHVCGTAPVIYGHGLYRAVAQRLKTQFNENSKVPAKWEIFPELDHNEIVGWEGAENLVRLFSVVLIRDRDEEVGIKRRIEITKELMHEEMLRIFEVWSQGKSTLAKMASVICVGDFASIYLAFLRGIDPTPVRTIAVLKEKLKSNGVRDKILRGLDKIVRQ